MWHVILNRLQTGWAICIGLLALLVALSAMPAIAQDAGQGVSADDPAALDPSALDRGRTLYFEGNYQGAYDAWKPLADAGNARALYNLSTLYRHGRGVDENAQKATELLLDSAEKGFPDAQYLYATTLFEGADDDEAQKQEAVRWWLAAARQDNELSQYRLGLLYWNGVAVARDLVRGHAWMGLASRTGVTEALDALKSMDRYLDDTQREEASALATRLLDKADKTGSQPVMTKAGFVAVKDPAPSPAPASSKAVAKSGPASAAKPTPAQRVTSAVIPPSTSRQNEAFDKSWRLQLLALKDAGDVQKEWVRLSTAAPDLLDDMKHQVVPAHLGERGTFYRLYIGPFASRDAANDRCRALKAAGTGCFIVAPDG